MIDPFPWSEAFAVRDERLDEEHRSMVGLINQICLDAAAGRHGKAVALLGELLFVAEAHFRHEETLLRRIQAEIGQPHLSTVVQSAIEDHAGAHLESLEALDRLVERTRAAVSAGEAILSCGELKSWFVEHAVGAEAQVKTILQSTPHLAEPY